MSTKEHERATSRVVIDVGDTTLYNIWNMFIEEYTLPFLESCLQIFHSLYTRLALMNTVIFIIKYVPTGLYMCKFIKDLYVTSRERIKQKQIEMDDIKLQIQIVNTKLSVRDAEFAERSEQLRISAEKLRKVRTRVRELIAADEVLRNAIENAEQWDSDTAHLFTATKEEDRDLLVELLKEFKYGSLSKAEKQPDKLNYSERGQTDPDSTSENSVYSSISDVDIKQDCRVKIVKVTNVYKIACLKHYMKQKRLRRANKNALLRKKMESIKELLDEWQKSLNMVINSKLTILNIDSHPMDVASQEAMGDYSKPHCSSDTDSDIRNSWSDLYDENSLNWTQYPYNLEDGSDGVSRELYDAQNYGDGLYQTPPTYCDRVKALSPNMLSIIEETNSQIAIEEIKSDTDDECDCRDLEYSHGWAAN